MKNIQLLIIAILGVIALSSCQKYLTVSPKTQVVQTDLLSTETGYKDALTGVYIQMKSNNSYGQNLTMTTIEQLISNWDVATNTTEQKLGLFNYTDANVDALMTSIYAQQYTIIASVNAILGQIDANKSAFTTPGLYELIKGECLAIRAYCHFDVLRIWGPIPTASGSAKIPPYVTALSNQPNSLTVYTQFQTQLLNDLTDAEKLLNGVDPILNHSLLNLSRPGSTATTFNPADTYFAFRYLRMNYYAVKALQARSYLWFNNTAKAYECSKVVINATNPDGTVKFRLGNTADMTAKDYALTPEQVFGLYDFNLYTKYNNLFANGTLKKGTAATTITGQLYGTTGTDIREVNLWLLITQPSQAKTYICQKYNVPQTVASAQADVNRIPMLRLSEMYFIAIETAPLAEAQTFWAAYRTARNIPVTILPSDPILLQNALLPEYRKEFYAEGQAFYAYKRLNSTTANVLFAPTGSSINYLFPLPKTELVK